jgi:DNA sulfur modification protein DndC
MTKNKKAISSAFDELGFHETIKYLIGVIQELYRSKEAPWIIGYSGGKDSSTVAQLVWTAIAGLPKHERINDIHIISTDTLVENPVVASWVSMNLKKMERAAKDADLPIYPHRLIPELKDSFWVNLIGKGYPAPRPLFRWCTSRLKINPSNKFISEIVNKSGEAILSLGMRKAESVARARVMNKIEKKRVKEFLTPNEHLPNSDVFTPIENWTDDDVWAYLLNNDKAPWNFNNNEILEMYKGASPDNECPLVVETGTQSCGKSRFGCWICTLVSKDSSMQAMIQNDDEKQWMEEMLKFRDELDVKNDRDDRDFRRMDGTLLLHNERLVHGPYKQSHREKLLKKLLIVQKNIKSKRSLHIPDFDLITMDELKEIRRIWVYEKHEIEDSLPDIYESIFEKTFPDKRNAYWFFGKEEMTLLKEECGDNEIEFELVRELLSIEKKFSFKVKRAGLFEELEKALRKHHYVNEEEALELALKIKEAKDNAKEGIFQELDFVTTLNNAEYEEIAKEEFLK